MDEDAFDARCTHITIHDRRSGVMVCTFRLFDLCPADIAASHAAQYYDLSALQHFDGRISEMGRFCIDPRFKDPDILRIAWAELTTHVDANHIKLLFGCASFAGMDGTAYLDAFALLKDRHLAPANRAPEVKAPDVFHYAERVRRKPNQEKAMAEMPPLLRSYLKMGAWVSDHAVVDRHMETLHVFTGLEIDVIPATRRRLLRALA
ncbi:MAG: GNAT family N-acyltransferase [Paracoccaceae bacterium]|nr:GNAT family N-acyltransferase [Paracoccaceae bacterium]